MATSMTRGSDSIANRPSTSALHRLGMSGSTSLGGADTPKRAPSSTVDCGSNRPSIAVTGWPGMSEPRPSITAHPRVYPDWSYR
jgi:hypothetical protein